MVAQATLNKQANALVTMYLSEFKGKYNREPVVNRYREKWGFLSMIEDLGYERAQEVIRFYFTTGRVGHPVNALLNNYDRLHKVMSEIAEDEANRERLRRETEERVKEWESARGDENSRSN
jgi:hypothetical protein